MTDAEFRDELKTLVRKHAESLDADGLRSAATVLEEIAEKWEAIDL